MDDIFFELYKSCHLETRGSRRARQTFAKLLEEITKKFGEDFAEELQMSANIVREEEGLSGFMEGFRFGMTVVSERL